MRVLWESIVKPVHSSSNVVIGLQSDVVVAGDDNLLRMRQRSDVVMEQPEFLQCTMGAKVPGMNVNVPSRDVLMKGQRWLVESTNNPSIVKHYLLRLLSALLYIRTRPVHGYRSDRQDEHCPQAFREAWPRARLRT